MNFSEIGLLSFQVSLKNYSATVTMLGFFVLSKTNWTKKTKSMLSYMST